MASIYLAIRSLLRPQHGRRVDLVPPATPALAPVPSKRDHAARRPASMGRRGPRHVRPERRGTPALSCRPPGEQKARNDEGSSGRETCESARLLGRVTLQIRTGLNSLRRAGLSKSSCPEPASTAHARHCRRRCTNAPGWSGDDRNGPTGPIVTGTPGTARGDTGSPLRPAACRRQTRQAMTDVPLYRTRSHAAAPPMAPPRVALSMPTAHSGPQHADPARVPPN